MLPALVLASHASHGSDDRFQYINNLVTVNDSNNQSSITHSIPIPAVATKNDSTTEPSSERHSFRARDTRSSNGSPEYFESLASGCPLTSDTMLDLNARAPFCLANSSSENSDSTLLECHYEAHNTEILRVSNISGGFPAKDFPENNIQVPETPLPINSAPSQITFQCPSQTERIFPSLLFDIPSRLTCDTSAIFSEHTVSSAPQEPNEESVITPSSSISPSQTSSADILSHATTLDQYRILPAEFLPTYPSQFLVSDFTQPKPRYENPICFPPMYDDAYDFQVYFSQQCEKEGPSFLPSDVLSLSKDSSYHHADCEDPERPSDACERSDEPTQLKRGTLFRQLALTLDHAVRCSVAFFWNAEGSVRRVLQWLWTGDPQLLHLFPPPRPSAPQLTSELQLRLVYGQPLPEQYKHRYDFAAYDSGARIIDSSPSIQNVKAIQKPDTDVYLLAPCEQPIWLECKFADIGVLRLTMVDHPLLCSHEPTI